ncbi:VPS10 domain-containing protein [Bizionia paragorgiae]|uniref:VPS10 domain-containing protein n=1 Tax=Bizionia paragorgiae TaxID=283786 RepID=UPI003A940468
MKNKFTWLILVLALSLYQKGFAQLEAVGSSDYGRIFNITYDPSVENKLYATSLYNHILVSNDNGQNWEVLFSMSVQDVTTFKDLKLARNNSALSFIKYNQGSANNTIIILDLNSNTVIDEIEIPYSSGDKYIESYSLYDADPNVILMNTKIDFGTLENTYYTTDGGQNWVLVYTKSEHDDVAINSVAINPSNPNHLILTRGLGPNNVEGSLFQSYDGGQTWEEKLQGVVLAPVVFNPHNTNVIYAGTGISFGSTDENLYRSVDGGENWNIVPITFTDEQLNDITYISFNPQVENSIIVLEENEIIISTDNGITWENYVHDTSDVHGYYYGTYLSFNPFNEEEIFITSNYHPQFSNDGGATLTWAKNNFYLSTGSIGLFPDGDGHLYYGVQYGYINRNLTTEEEANFDILPIDWFTQGDAPTLFTDKFVEGRIFTFSSGWFGSDLEVSIDHGQNKHPILNTFMNFFDAAGTDPFDSSVIWFSLSDTNGNVELKRADISDLNAIVTNDITLPESGIIKGIHFDPLNQGHVLITIGTTVYKSEDYGANWTLSNSGLELLDNRSDLILSLNANPLNDQQLTIATNIGVFTSLDNGETWNRIYDELVHQIFHSTATAGHLVGMAHSSRISEFTLIYSTDEGQTWETIENDDLLSIGSVASAVKFNEQSADVYIGSVDLGLVKYSIDLQTLGLEENILANQDVIIFPNPTTDLVNVTISGEKPKSVSLFDVTGKKLMDVYNTSELNLSQLSAGIYMLHITTEFGKTTIKKVVKN